MNNNRNYMNLNELHTTVHWREIRKILERLAHIEHLNLSNYNTQKIRCYSCVGDDLEGRNANYYTEGGYSPFVCNNSYDIFEVPAYNNVDHSNFSGNYLFLAHNKSFDKWIFGTMSYTVDWTATANTGCLQDEVSYVPYGMYTFTYDGDYTVVKEQSGDYVTYGGAPSAFSDQRFDRIGARKRAYGKTEAALISKAQGKKAGSSKNVKGGAQVRIYNKNKQHRKKQR